MEDAELLGLRVDDALKILRQASEIVNVNEIIEACRFWRERRPDRPFTPKTVKEASADYLSRQQRVSERRRRGLKCYYDQLCEKFGNRNLHDLSTLDLRDFVDSKTWSPKTYNEVLGGYSLLYREAQLRNWVPAGCNPRAGIKRLNLLSGNIGIFGPEQVRMILNRVKEDLIPFVAVWFFAGCRKEEIARLKWPQIRAAIKTAWRSTRQKHSSDSLPRPALRLPTSCSSLEPDGEQTCILHRCLVQGPEAIIWVAFSAP